jgi:hypothetical protein
MPHLMQHSLALRLVLVLLLLVLLLEKHPLTLLVLVEAVMGTWILMMLQAQVLVDRLRLRTCRLQGKGHQSEQESTP